MSQSDFGGYAGDVSVIATFEALKSEPRAVLIDVRTRAEWSYVGIPSLDEIGKEPVLVEWHSFGAGPDPAAFADILAGRLKAIGVATDAPLFFICRSGQRSRSAAIVMTAAGYTQCFNVTEGFEGPLGPERHRGALAGWKAEGLPWKQT